MDIPQIVNHNKIALPKIIYIVFFTFLSYWSANGQVLHYEVIRGVKSIGNVDVIRTLENGVATYKLENIVEFKVLFTFSVKYILNVLRITLKIS